MKKTCETCYYGIYTPSVDSIVCTNPDGVYQKRVRDDRTCRDWRPEKLDKNKELLSD